jgi:hypothetical protein
MNNDKNFEVISLLSRVNRSKILKPKNKKISGAYSIPDYRNIGYDIYNDYSLNTLDLVDVRDGYDNKKTIISLDLDYWDEDIVVDIYNLLIDLIK